MCSNIICTACFASWAHGLCHGALQTILRAVVVAKVMYGSSTWWGFDSAIPSKTQSVYPTLYSIIAVWPTLAYQRTCYYSYVCCWLALDDKKTMMRTKNCAGGGQWQLRKANERTWAASTKTLQKRRWQTSNSSRFTLATRQGSEWVTE